MSDTKQCPYCGGEIKSTAKKCKHCGKWLETNEGSQKDENQICPPSLVSEPQIRRVKPVSSQPSKEEDNKPRAKGSSKKTILYIVIGVIGLIGIIVLIKFIPIGEPRKVSDFENGVILYDKGDSIAAAIAASDWSNNNAAIWTKQGREKQAKELVAERYSNALSDEARRLITNQRFNEIYMEYYVNYEYELGSPEYRFKSVWYIFPQLDLYRIIEDRKDEKSSIRLKNYQAQYNKTLKAFIQDAEKKGWDSDKINSLLMIELPDFDFQRKNINNGFEETITEAPTQYGEWSLGSLYFHSHLSDDDGTAKISIQLRPEAVFFSCLDLNEIPSNATIELSASPYEDAHEINLVKDDKRFKITKKQDIEQFLNACEKGYDMKFLFLLDGSQHWGWYDFNLKKLKGATSAYNASK